MSTKTISKKSATTTSAVATTTTLGSKKAKKTMSPTTSTDSLKNPSHVTATPAPAPAAAPPPSSGGGTTLVQPPPANAVIPDPPAGFVPATGSAARWLAPSVAEQNALTLAVGELRGFANFAQIFGLLGVPESDVVQLFDVGDAWTSMRNRSAAWDRYAAAQERTCWNTMRGTMKRMKPLFQMALTLDPSLATKYPNLTALFAAKAIAAKTSVATRQLNRAAVAAGKPPSHGAVGKKRMAASAKALLLQAQAGGAKSQPSAATSGAAGGTALPGGGAPTTH